MFVSGKRPFLFLALTCAALTPTPCLATPVIEIEIVLDETTLLIGYPGGFAGDLKNCPFHPVRKNSFRPEPGEPLTAILRGKLVVKEYHGGWQAVVSELKLTRKHAEADEWYLDPDWVDAHEPKPVPKAEKASSQTGDRHRTYQEGTTIAIGAAGLSCVGCLAGLALLVFARGRYSVWVLLFALLLGVAAVVRSRMDIPYFPDDDEAYDRRSYAFYAAATSGLLAAVGFVVAWVSRKRREASATR
jgi:hypothetical protein